MILKRRDTPSILHRVSNFFWPRSGFPRAWRYISRRVQRLSDKPGKIALGFACGAFASFTPFFGMHFIIAGALAYMLRGNIIASLAGTAVGNPLTFPFIAAGALSLGGTLTGRTESFSNPETVVSDFLNILSSIWNAMMSSLGMGGSTPVGWSEALSQIAGFWSDVMFPYLIGGALLGVIASCIAYLMIKPVIAAYHSRRRIRFERARAARLAKPSFVASPAI